MEEIVHGLPRPHSLLTFIILAFHVSFTLGHFVGVVRKTQVHATRVDINGSIAYVLEDGVGHGRAFNVPTRTTLLLTMSMKNYLTPRRRPRRLSRLASLPQGEIGGIALLRDKVTFFSFIDITNHFRNYHKSKIEKEVLNFP